MAKSSSVQKAENYLLAIPTATYESEIYDTLWDIHAAATALRDLKIVALPDIPYMETFARQMAEIIESRYERLYAVLGMPEGHGNEYPGKMVPAKSSRKKLKEAA